MEASLERFAERFFELTPDLLACRGVVLPAAVGDLDGTHHRGQARATLPAPAARHAVEQTRAVGVAAARGVDHRLGTDGLHVDAFSIRVDARALATAGHDDGADAARELLHALAGLVLDH